ncbi:hypothetical protein M438DRAFT_30333 [Aureobasidium pullulans EXF-150]|uniref:Uncharacterized protein n=1 Tax=Aureobasidium pullulans EXF-150 TaxID=1043002 RepID=A0A074XCQ8_AURPU|nr:uncharacterized protein M438DRAFT_30333 [Aureobasidium pullulans EXF-150]KEQ83300.1 hypothetical protein M438DRAFT_30333 [Aureobasidium pullulans EXF-150]
MPSVVWCVEMHNFLKIGLVVRREALTIKPLVEGCTDLKNIVHFHSMRVTKFCRRGGWMGASTSRHPGATVRSKKWNLKISWLGSVSRWPGNGGSQW